MGYILPVNSFQSQQYANRMMEHGNFAEISRVPRVNAKSDFQRDFETPMSSQQIDRERMQEKSSLASSQSKSDYVGYIYPNPANLSPAISQVVGKGLAINTYA